jgi:plasmid stabilization system protein ParE
MRRLDFTPRARRDIEEIWEYSVDQFGLDRADFVGSPVLFFKASTARVVIVRILHRRMDFARHVG